MIRLPRSAVTSFSLLVLLAGSVVAATACGDDDGGSNHNAPPVLSREDALRACVAADACDVMPFLYAALCVEANWDQQYQTGTVPIWSTIYRCVLSHLGDCPGIQACFGGGSDPQPCATASDGRCDGNTRVYCDTFDQRLYTQNCLSANQVCVMSEVVQGVLAPVCGLGSCDPQTDSAECRGNLLVNCDAGVLILRDCAADGLTCGDGLQGRKACVGGGGQCDETTFTPTCEGSVLTRCVQNQTNVVDCASLVGDLTCEPGQDQCVVAGTQCDSGQESCQVSTIRVCVDGTFQVIDCLDLGFSRCETRAGGAHCRP